MVRTGKIRIFAFILLAAEAIFSQAPVNIAVLELEAKGIAVQDASVLTDKLRGELISTGRFQVIERGMMNKVLEEQGFQQSGACTSNECVVEIGQLIGVNQMVAGSIGKIENTYLISIRLVDVATGRINKNVQREITGTLTDILKKGIAEVSAELAGKVAPPAAAASLPTPVATVPETNVKTTIPPEEKPVNPPPPQAGKKTGFSVGAGYLMSMGFLNLSEDDATLPTHGGCQLKIKFSGVRFGWYLEAGELVGPAWEDDTDNYRNRIEPMLLVSTGI